MITATQVRAKFGGYKDFVFEFEFTNKLSEVETHVCDFAPDGWDAQSINFVRSRSKWGVFRSYTSDLSFVDTDLTFLESYMADFKTEGDLKLNIYDLNNTINEYELLYSGKVDLSKYEKKDYKLKISLIDTDLANYIEVNGDKEYNVNYADVDEAKKFTYAGLKSLESGRLRGIDNGSASRGGGSFYYILPGVGQGDISVDATVSQIQPQQFDAYAIPSFLYPFFEGGETGVLQINGNYTFSIGQTNVDNSISRMTIKLLGADAGLYATLFDKTYSPASNLIYEDVVISEQINVILGSEVFLVVTLYPISTIEALNIDYIFDGELNLAFIGHQTINTDVPAVKIGTVMSNLLGQVTENKYTSIELPSDEFLLLNGNWSRNITEQPLKLKLKDFMDFICKAYGCGYEFTTTGLKFSPIADFFGSTSLLQFEEVKGFAERSLPDYLINSVTAGCEVYDSEYVGGKLSIHEKTTFKTPVNSVKNALDLSLPISVNAYEIDAMFRKINAMSNADGTDFEEDNDIFLIHATTNIISDDYDVVIMPITTALSSKTGIESFIFNVKFTPARIIERNLLIIQPSLVNDTDTVNMTARTKNVDFYLTEQTKGTYYEGRNFKISPRCGTTTDPILTDNNFKIEAVQYEFTAPTKDFDVRTILNNTSNLILFSYNGVRYAGYIDDFTNNPYNEEAKTIKLIKAHLTSAQIDQLWQ